MDRTTHTGGVTILATSDLHGYARDWDYVADAPHTGHGHGYGLARVATIVSQVRDEGVELVVVDGGDTLQGSALDDFHAQPVHPMAVAMNLIGYDAVCVGNHDFNGGLEALGAFASDLSAPMLAANVRTVGSGELLCDAYTLVERDVGGRRLRVGIVGVTTPGSLVWDRRHLEGRIEISDAAQAAREAVAAARLAGADIVMVLSHGGIGPSTYSLDLPPENAADAIAATVGGIDAVIMGHTHRDEPGRLVVGPEHPVVLAQPRYWGSSVIRVDLEVRFDGHWQVTGRASRALYAAGVPEDEGVLEAIAPAHEATRRAVARVVTRSTVAMDTRDAYWRPSPLLDLVGRVMIDRVTERLAGTSVAGLPVVAVVSPLTRTAVWPVGDVTVGNVWDLYLYPNVLEAVEVTGAQLRDYLEWAARYFADVAPEVAFDPVTMTSAVRGGVQLWDFLFDLAHGVQYMIDIARPVGERIIRLAHLDGHPVAADERLILALDNYRRGGGGGYPHVEQAPVVLDDGEYVRDLILAWLEQRPVLDPADWFVPSWSVVVGERD